MKTSGSDPNQNQLEILEHIQLQSFTAKPDALQPFGEAEISWEVTGPDGFGVTLNGLPVQRSAHMTVAPRVSTGYALSAYAGTGTKPLASLGISVDTASCIKVEASPGFRKSLLQDCVGSALGANADLSLAPTDGALGSNLPQLQPQLWFTQGAMNLKLYLLVDTHNTVAGPLGLDATISTNFIIDGGGKIVPADTSIVATVDPGVILDIAGLFVDLHMGDKANAARMDFQKLVDAIPQFISIGYLIDPKMRYQNISIPGDPADPPFTIVACPLPGPLGTIRSGAGAIAEKSL
jgi:hypothetical protein